MVCGIMWYNIDIADDFGKTKEVLYECIRLVCCRVGGEQDSWLLIAWGTVPTIFHGDISAK